MNTASDTLLTPLEAARHLGVTPGLVAAYCRPGFRREAGEGARLHAVTVAGRTRFAVDELDRFDAELRQPWVVAGEPRPAVPDAIVAHLRAETRIVAMLPEAEVTLPGASLPSVLISLALFNAVFAVQNGLDLAFLWSGAPLPNGVSLADYAHRGAYPLIVTALLAGVFVLATMKPGSSTAASPAIRRLVVIWVAQNLLLVASSMRRYCHRAARHRSARDAG